MSSTDTATGILYRERLWPAPWLWFIAVLIAAMTIVIVFPISPPASIIVFFLVLALLVWWLTSLSAIIVVTHDTLVAGKAHIDRKYLGRARGYSGEDSRAAKGPDLDVRSFLMIRPWITDSVVVEIRDEKDPTPYWLLSSKRPAELAATLNADLS